MEDLASGKLTLNIAIQVVDLPKTTWWRPVHYVRFSRE